MGTQVENEREIGTASEVLALKWQNIIHLRYPGMPWSFWPEVTVKEKDFSVRQSISPVDLVWGVPFTCTFQNFGSFVAIMEDVFKICKESKDLMNLQNFEIHKTFYSFLSKHNSTNLIVPMWTLACQVEILETSFAHPAWEHMGHTKRTSFGMACGLGKLPQEHWERKHLDPAWRFAVGIQFKHLLLGKWFLVLPSAFFSIHCKKKNSEAVFLIALHKMHALLLNFFKYNCQLSCSYSFWDTETHKRVFNTVK